MKPQITLQSALRFKGIGLHNGENSELSIYPAPANHGIIFQKVNQNNAPKIRAQFNAVDTTLMSTNIGSGAAQVATVEHLLSAIYALGIDNALIQINGNEVPILDGSSAPFVYGLKKIGLAPLEEQKKYLRVKKAVQVNYKDCYAKLEPYDGFKLSFEINFNHPYIMATQCKYSLDLTESSEDYENSVALARTFGFIKDLEYLTENNLAKGASDKNALVLQEENLSPNQTLRNKAEFVQHKLLDAIGDLSLCGYNLQAQYHGYKAGHKLNNQLLHELFSDQENYEIVGVELKSQQSV